MEAGGGMADMVPVAQRDRQDSANSLDIAARSAALFNAASSGGGGGRTADAGLRPRSVGARFRTASNSGLRQQSEAAGVGMLERQVGVDSRQARRDTTSSQLHSLDAASVADPELHLSLGRTAARRPAAC